MPKIQFRCNKCGRLFDYEIAAIECEESHDIQTQPRVQYACKKCGKLFDYEVAAMSCAVSHNKIMSIKTVEYDLHKHGELERPSRIFIKMNNGGTYAYTPEKDS